MDDNSNVRPARLSVRLADAVEKGRAAAIKIAKQTNTNLVVWGRDGKVMEISPEEYLADLAAERK